MLSTRPLALDDGPATYAYTRTPAKGLLKNRGALQENTTTVLRGLKTLNTGKGKAVALRTPTQNHQYSARKNGSAFQTAKKLTPVVKYMPPKTNRTNNCFLTDDKTIKKAVLNPAYFGFRDDFGGPY